MSTTKQATEETIRDLCPRALMYRGTIPNLDTCEQNGIWWTNASTQCASPPSWMALHWKYAVVEVIRRDVTFQRLTCQEGVAVRVILADGTAKPWQKMSPSLV